MWSRSPKRFEGKKYLMMRKQNNGTDSCATERSTMTKKAKAKSSARIRRPRMFYLAAIYILVSIVAVVVVGGEFAEFALDFSSSTGGGSGIQSAIIIQVNSTTTYGNETSVERRCGPSVSNLFPNRTVILAEEDDPQIQQRSRIRMSSVVTIYNSQQDEVCDIRRKQLLLTTTDSDKDSSKNRTAIATIHTFRIYTFCIGCDEESSDASSFLRVDPDDLIHPPLFESVSSTSSIRSLVRQKEDFSNNTGDIINTISYSATLNTIIFPSDTTHDGDPSMFNSKKRLSIRLKQGKFFLIYDHEAAGDKPSCNLISAKGNTYKQKIRMLGGDDPSHGIGVKEEPARSTDPAPEVIVEVAGDSTPTHDSVSTRNHGIGMSNNNDDDPENEEGDHDASSGVRASDTSDSTSTGYNRRGPAGRNNNEPSIFSIGSDGSNNDDNSESSTTLGIATTTTTTTQTNSINDDTTLRHEQRQFQCNTIEDECCSDSDCDNNNICVWRTCIDEGHPRFTLMWIGDDDLDLYVLTPDGAILDYDSLFDPASGGRVGEPVEQTGTGFHVENIYFPIEGDGGPLGEYTYYVRPIVTVGSPDVYTVTVHDKDGEVARHDDVRFSPMFTYNRGGVPIPTPMPIPTTAPVRVPTPRPQANPTQSPEESIPTFSPVITISSIEEPDGLPGCNPSVDECCETSQCSFEGDICVHRTCIHDGNPRITLMWIGDDDLDLFVETPDGTELSFKNFYDPITGGRVGEDVDQLGFGYHVENVYFPFTGAPPGVYRIYVRPLTIVEEDDAWAVNVVDEGQTVLSQSGVGASEVFFYVREPQEPSPSPPSPTTPAPMLPTPPGPPTTQSPVGMPTPTSPPQTDEACSVFFDECCDDSDCRTILDRCVQRTCIREGNPRFTLSWTGDDDLELFVRTPDGIVIDSMNTFDIFSGGRYTIDDGQSGFGQHVESVNFPILQTPTGVYEYGVRSTTIRTNPDSWTLQVFDGGDLQITQEGNGESETFMYDRDEAFEGPQRPRPMPPRCSPISDECCLDSDCMNPSEVCVQRACIDEGNPRITLTWIGDDDLDLFVETPGGAVISRDNPVDPVSGGRYGEPAAQSEFGFHVESIFFPATGAPFGAYTYYMRRIATSGIGADVWRIRVYENGEEVEQQVGIGDSREFIYFRMGQTGPTIAPVPTPPGACGASDECCTDTDCGLMSGEVCENRNCVVEGNPRFTLTWVGDDDWNLSVTTPYGDVISSANPQDRISGGEFGGEAVQTSFGYHAESIYFPLSGGPFGTYTAAVSQGNQRGSADQWILRVYDGDSTEILTTSGSSASNSIIYERTGVFTSAPAPSPSGPNTPTTERPPVANPPTDVRPCPHECCSDANCNSGDLCIQRTCIADGTPRFTLSWTGNDDLNLVVISPDGVTISTLNPIDLVSGGVFNQDSNQNEIFGFHVENVAYPNQNGPEGRYSYFVEGPRVEGAQDSWTLRVYAFGQLVAWNTGSGESRIFSYDFGGIQIPPTPPAEPTPPPIPTPSPVPVTCNSASDCRPGEICSGGTCVDAGPAPTPTPPTPAPVPVPCINASDCPPGQICSEGTCVSPPVPTIPPATSGPTPENPFCNPQVHECCTNSDCEPGFEVCEQQVCIDEGNPRFTLTWTGNDDLDLAVITPFETVVSYTNPNEPASGGKFGESGDQFGFGRHVENVFFPLQGGPLGVYTYFVKNFLPTGNDDIWTVRVFVNGEVVNSTTGTGDSELLMYEFGGVAQPPSPPTPPSPPPSPGPPTPPPVPDETCDIEEEECCINSDCIPGVEICVQRTCIDLGNPRFTLLWTGDDDLDLSVKTPVGTTISFIQPVDELTGGVYGENGVQFLFGRHVENIFFPLDRTPFEGIYEYTVRSFIPRGINDRWTVEVYIFDRQVSSFSGTGDATFTYEITDDQNIMVPTAAPLDFCNTAQDECCDNFDCIVGLEVCENRNCIQRGNPRFTLTWIGDDDLDLAVVTPLGTTVAISNIEDEASGGVFGESGDQFEYGHHAENAFFPLSGGPAGTYTYFVSSFVQVGDPDMWTVSVYVDDIEVDTHTGAGGSQFFVFEFMPPTTSPIAGPGPTTPSPTPAPMIEPTPSPTQPPIPDQEPTTPSPVDTPSPITPSPIATPSPTPSGQTPAPAEPNMMCDASPAGTDECCVDDDCNTSMNQLCVQRTCIDDGNPRFTLTWNGNDDYDLLVRGPIGGTISFINQFDEESGGVFGENGVQQFPGLHVENIFFPIEGGPVGEYLINVETFAIFDDADTWRLGIYVDGVEVEFLIGTGDSGDITYEYTQGSNMDVGVILTCNLANDDECCDDGDCNGVELCVQRTCINDGNPRFTLTWMGDDDLDLIVDTPMGDELSYYFPVDNRANGRFHESGKQFQYGLHVESINFATEGAPYGKYKFWVETFTRIGTDDEWTVQVIVDGSVVQEVTGQKNSGEFEFVYEGRDETDLEEGQLLLGVGGGNNDYDGSGDGDSADEEDYDGDGDSEDGDSEDGDCLTVGGCCQVTSDCTLTDNNNVCLGGHCVSGGPLTFTLIWTSTEGSLQFSVMTPGFLNNYQSDTTNMGGGENNDDNDYDDIWESYDNEHTHIRNLIFTEPSVGRYNYAITALHTGGPTMFVGVWEMWIHDGTNGNILKFQNGTSPGSAALYGFIYDDSM